MSKYKDLIDDLNNICLIAPDKLMNHTNKIRTTAMCAIFAIRDLDTMIEDIYRGNTPQPKSTDSAVNHPSHYCNGGIECIEAIKASMTKDGFCDYCKGNAIKYLWRWRDKGGIQDLEKAQVYLDWLIDVAKGDTK